jgi:hypothetical protein
MAAQSAQKLGISPATIFTLKTYPDQAKSFDDVEAWRTFALACAV